MYCKYCDKSYTKKSSLDRHEILCEFIFKTKREKKIEEEERSDLPPYHILVRIVGELALKNAKLEEKLSQLEKRKNKINPIELLKSSPSPQICFSEYHNTIVVEQKHIELLLEKRTKMVHVVMAILEQIFDSPSTSGANNSRPIVCISNTFYIYDVESQWSEIEKGQLVKFLNQVDRKIWKEFKEWQKINQDKINSNEQMSIKRDEMQAKIAGIDYKDDSILNKIKTHLQKCV